jgi:hypothetical protein
MLPIVNGLENDLGGDMAFERRNANTAAGRATMQIYGLRGHPSYLLAAPTGEALWSFSGPATDEFLRGELSRFLGRSSQESTDEG